VPDVPHGPTLIAPLGEQSSNLNLSAGVVSNAATCPTGMVDRILKVDQQKDTTRRGQRGAHPESFTQAAPSSTSRESA
jgi:hypothetical protein